MSQHDSMPNMVHFTEGGPWFGYQFQDYSREWIDELKDLLAGNNPRAHALSIGRLVTVNFGDDHGT